MTQQIIDTDELDKLPKYWSSVHKCYMVMAEDVRALIANSPQADGMVLVPSEPTEEMLKSGIDRHLPQQIGQERLSMLYKAMLSAYKPQADDVPSNETISVSINQLAELRDLFEFSDEMSEAVSSPEYVIPFVHSQILKMKSQADDVRKDAERYRWLRNTARSLDWSTNIGNGWVTYSCRINRDDMDKEIDQAIDKARE